MLSRFSIPPPLELSEQTQRYQQKRRFTSVETNRANGNNTNKQLLPSKVISHHAREAIPSSQENNIESENSEESEEYEHSLRTSASPSSTTLSSISGRDFSDEEEEEEEEYLEEENDQVVNNNDKKNNNQTDHCTLEQTQLPSHDTHHIENISQTAKMILINNDSTSTTNNNTQLLSSLSPVTSSEYTNTTSINKETVESSYEHKESSASPSPELPLNSSTETTQLREIIPSTESSSPLLKKEEMEQKEKQEEHKTLPSSILLSQPLTSTIQTSVNAQREKYNTGSSPRTQEEEKEEYLHHNLQYKHEHLISSKPTIHVERTSSLQKVNEENELQVQYEERERKELEHDNVKASSNSKESSPYVYNNNNINHNTEFTSSAPVESGLVKSTSLAPEITPYLLTHLSNDELNSIIREQGERIRTLVMERSNAQLLIAEQQRVIHTLTHNSEKFTHNMETREQECTSLRNKLKAVESECAALKDKTQLQEAEIVQFNNTWTQRSQHMKRELQALIDERNTLQAQRDEVLHNHRTLRLETEKMESQVAQIKISTTREKEMYKKELEEQMQSRLRDKEEILAVREDEIRREKINLEKMLRNVSDENNHLRELNETSHDDVSQLNKLLHKKETALETYKHKLTQLRTEVREKEEILEKERNSFAQKLERIVSSHQTELSHVQSQLKSSTSEVEALQLQISSLQDRHQHEQNKIKQEQRLHNERNDYKEREWHHKLEEWKNKWVHAEEAHSQSISTINTLQREKESINNQVQQLSLLLREARSELQQKKEHYLVAENKIELLLRKLHEKDKLIETYRIQAERELWQETLIDNNICNNFIKNKKSIGWKNDNKSKKQKELMILNKDNHNNVEDDSDIEYNKRIVNKSNTNNLHHSVLEEEEQREMITREHNANKKGTTKVNVQPNNKNNIKSNRNTEIVSHRSREHPANRERSEAINNKINSMECDKRDSHQQQQEHELQMPCVVEKEITKCEKERTGQNKPNSQHFTTINNKLNSTTATHHKYSSLPRQSWSYSTRGISPISIITSNSLPLQPELHSQSPWRSSSLQKGTKRVTKSLHEYNICEESNEADNHTETLTAFREQSPLVHSYNNLGVGNVNGHNTKGNNNNNNNKENEIRRHNDRHSNHINKSQTHLGCTDNGKIHYTHYNNENSNNNEVYFDDSVFIPSPLAKLSSSSSLSSEFLFTVRNKLQQLRPPFAVSSHSPSPSSPLESNSNNNKNNNKVVHSTSPLPVLHPDWHTNVNKPLEHKEEHHQNNNTSKSNKHIEEYEHEEEEELKRNVDEEIVFIILDKEHNNNNKKVYSSGIALSSPLSPPPLGEKEKIQVIEPIRETKLETSKRPNNINQEWNTELYPLSLIQQIVQQTMEQYHTSRQEISNKSTPECSHVQYCKSISQEAAENDLREGHINTNTFETNHELSNNKNNKLWNVTTHEQEKTTAAVADYTKEHKIIVSPRRVHHRREITKQLSTLHELEENEEQSLEPLSYLSEIPENNSNDSLKSDLCNQSNNNNINKSNIYNDMSKSTISENKTFFHDNEMIANLTWSDEVRMLASPPRTSHTFDKTRTNALNVIEAQLIDQSSIESM